MKKTIALALTLVLLLAGCAAPGSGAETAPVTEAPAEDGEAAALIGMWRNAGQYSEGRDFVETMTLNEDGSCTIHLDYQGEDYQTLNGSYEVRDSVLYTDLDTGNGRVQRSFQYTLDGRELILQNEQKSVTYIRVD